MSIDVLEHLPLADIQTYWREAHRVLAPGGRLFVCSNPREGSRLDIVVRGARLLSRWLARRGVIDDRRDRLRKSDHVKAIATYPQLVSVLNGCGFRVEQVVFWNGLFQSLIENLLVKLAESALLTARGGLKSRPGTASSAQNDDDMRSSVKDRLERKGLEYRVMRLLTELMWLDL